VDMDSIVVLVTVPEAREADVLAEALLSDKLAACVNIIGGVRSLFLWKGKKDSAEECLLVAKTSQRLFEDFRKKVRELHSYDVPEIIALPIVRCDSDYFEWMTDELTNSG